MEDHATFREEREGDVRNSTTDNDRNAVQRDALPDRVGNFLPVWIKPASDVLAFDAKRTGDRMSQNEVQALVTRQRTHTDVAWRLLLAVERAVIVGIEVTEAAGELCVLNEAEATIDSDL